MHIGSRLEGRGEAASWEFVLTFLVIQFVEYSTKMTQNGMFTTTNNFFYSKTVIGIILQIHRCIHYHQIENWYRAIRRM